MDEKNSVLWYTQGHLSIPVYFPEGKEDCRHCIRFCRSMEDLKLFKCSLLEVSIEPCDLDTRHPECPIDFSSF